MRKLAVAAAILTISAAAVGQTKQNDVVAAAGGNYESSSAIGSFTIGEPVVGTLEAGSIVLVQGFQQGYVESFDTTSVLMALADVSIYPNPVNSDLYIGLSELPRRSCRVLCFDMTGRLIETITYEPSVMVNFNMSGYQQGFYMIKVITDDKVLCNKKIMKKYNIVSNLMCSMLC